jgi:hypothetical protein
MKQKFDQKIGGNYYFGIGKITVFLITIGRK